MRAALGRLALLACLWFQAAPAQAHFGFPSSVPPGVGVPIPGLTHGEMSVVARHRSEILRLARAQVQTDETFRLLLRYQNTQAAYCLWGLVPGSITDETSPFNGCAHAFLAATWVLMDQMRGMPGASAAADSIAIQVDAENQAGNAGFVLCSFSGTSFTTAQLIVPSLLEAAAHVPTLMRLFGALLMAASVALVWTSTRRKAGAEGAGSAGYMASVQNTQGA